METPSTEPHSTLIRASLIMFQANLLQQRINVLTEVKDTGIAKDDVKNDEIKKLRIELKEEEKCSKKKRDC